MAHPFLPFVLLLLAASLGLVLPVRAQLQVQVTTNAVDEDDQHCLAHGTLSTQTIDVTNAGTQPVTATLYCSVPGGVLRVAAVTPPTQVAPGATDRLYCSLFDFQDPPLVGAQVPFDVEVNGQTTHHTVDVVCRNTSGPGQRCAASRLTATAEACAAELRALAAYAETGDMAAFEQRLTRSVQRLAGAFARAEAKAEGQCPADGDFARTLAVLTELEQPLLEFVSEGNMGLGSCGAAKLRALAKKCRGDFKAWSRYAKHGDALRVESALAHSDAVFEKRYAKALRADTCTISGERDWLRLPIDGATSRLAAAHALTLGPGYAELLRPFVEFAPGERERRLWLPMPATGALLFESTSDVHAIAFDRAGNAVAVGGEFPIESRPGTAVMRLPGPVDHVNVVLRRSGDLRQPGTVTAVVTFDEPGTVFVEDAFFDAMIYSPLRSFPNGEEVNDPPLGSGFETFAAWVEGEWGWHPDEGFPALQWLVQELLFGTCPAGAPASAPPTGAAHDQHYCGIATFINSMEFKFPGAMAPDVATNPQEWDRIGDMIGHSNVIGTPGSVLTDSVAQQFSGVRLTQMGSLAGQPIIERTPTPAATLDGRFFCSDRIRDISPANLAAWAQDCDLKLLVFDVYNPASITKPFGHWANVTQVTPDPTDATKATMQLQDYNASYPIGYDADAGSAIVGSNPAVAFGASPAVAGSAMASNFGASNLVCGDDRDEYVYFYVVCECDRTDPLRPRLPTQTRSGTSLNR